MKFENTQVFGLENAIFGMRLPMCKDLSDAMSKSDSKYEVPPYCDTKFIVGEDDLKIAKNLINADSSGGGQPNSKFLRMIHVQVAITAPLYFFKEMDTYKVGTVANSTSTMHKLASTPITKDCFEMDDFEDVSDIDTFGFVSDWWDNNIYYLEELRQKYNETKDKRYWKELIRLLPESWLQTRMFDCDYATLRNIYKWRKNHKLTEWHKFCDWIKELPYAEYLLTDEVGK